MPFQDPSNPGQKQSVSGNPLTCSFPDHSLFQSVSEGTVPELKYPSGRALRRGARPEPSKFPVFFPVSREFGRENSSYGTASSASQSQVFSRFPCLQQEPQLCGLFAAMWGRPLSLQSASILGSMRTLHNFSRPDRKVHFSGVVGSIPTYPIIPVF
jgi:hypothetical protein